MTDKRLAEIKKHINDIRRVLDEQGEGVNALIVKDLPAGLAIIKILSRDDSPDDVFATHEGGITLLYNTFTDKPQEIITIGPGGYFSYRKDV